MASRKDRIFFDALLKVNKYIDNHYDEGGFLPSENKLTEMFEFSYGTIRTVLTTIVKNGFIKSYHRQGHYVVPRKYRIKKVGIVLGSGVESPFVGNGKIFGSLTYRLEHHDIHCQIIQSRLPEKLKWRALAHGIQLLIWLFPQENLLSHINNKDDMIDLPQLVFGYHYCKNPEALFDVPYIVADYQSGLRKMISFLLKRGHNLILSLSAAEENKQLFKEFMAKGLHYDESLFIDLNKINWEDKLKNLINTSSFSSLILPGRDELHEKVYTLLSDLPADKQPEILLASPARMEYFMKMFPKINIVGYSIKTENLEKAATREIAGFINNNTEIHSHKLDSHQLKILS